MTPFATATEFSMPVKDCRVGRTAFNGKHVGEGGPVPATGQQTHSHQAYAITLGDNSKVSSMTKIWNAPWALKELGRA